MEGRERGRGQKLEAAVWGPPRRRRRRHPMDGGSRSGKGG